MTNNYKENICANIAYLRKTHGLSGTAMSKLLHITVKSLDRLEQGDFPHRMNFSVVSYAAFSFNVSNYDIMYTQMEKTAVFH